MPKFRIRMAFTLSEDISQEQLESEFKTALEEQFPYYEDGSVQVTEVE